jgi:hypothetical protein
MDEKSLIRLSEELERWEEGKPCVACKKARRPVYRYYTYDIKKGVFRSKCKLCINKLWRKEKLKNANPHIDPDLIDIAFEISGDDEDGEEEEE